MPFLSSWDGLEGVVACRRLRYPALSEAGRSVPGMACTQVVGSGQQRTWTVVDDVGALIEPAEEFLEFAREQEYSPNTVRSYARALAMWWTFLSLRQQSWDSVQLKDLGAFLHAVRAGTAATGAVPLHREPVAAESTVVARVRAVMSLYRFHALNGTQTRLVLYEQVRRSPNTYLPFMEHLERRSPSTPRATIRLRVPARPTPFLSPGQVQALLDGEAIWDPRTGTWTGDLRYRLLWAVLAETGMRIGEALLLTHGDWQTGQGTTGRVRLQEHAHPEVLRLKSGSRTVHIGSDLDRLYGDYVWWLCDQGADAALTDWDASFIFCNTKREPLFAPLKPRAVERHMKVTAHRVGVVPGEVTPHWLRHTHATALLLAGTPVHVVSRRLGHRNIQTTLDTYGHVTEDAELAALADWASYTKGWIN